LFPGDVATIDAEICLVMAGQSEELEGRGIWRRKRREMLSPG
jgi:hypothetical protein